MLIFRILVVGLAPVRIWEAQIVTLVLRSNGDATILPTCGLPSEPRSVASAASTPEAMSAHGSARISP